VLVINVINYLKPSAAIYILAGNDIERIGQLSEGQQEGCDETNEQHGPHLGYELTLNMLCFLLQEFILTM
jgi:hypothetical protein